MSKAPDEAVALDIVESSRRILDFVEGLDYQAFRRDPKTRSAVLYELLIIGEAAKRLSSDFCQEHSQIPWSEIARMRDKLIHHYRATSSEQVWETARRDVPELIKVLEPLLYSAPEGGSPPED